MHSYPQNKFSKLTYLSVIVLGVVFYFYYGVYKMLFVQFEIVGGDFMHVYDAAENLLKGVSIDIMPEGATTYYYPPFAALIITPFTLFDKQVARCLWLLLCHLLVIVSGILLYRVGKDIDRMVSVLSIALSLGFSMPLQGVLLTGNVNILIFFGLSVFFYELFFGKVRTAPYILALCTNIKIYPAIFTLAFPQKGSGNNWLKYIISFFAIGILSVIWLGLEEHYRFLIKLPNTSEYVGIFQTTSLMLIIKLITGNLPSVILTIITACMLLGILALWYRLRRNFINHYRNAKTGAVDLFLLISTVLVTFPSAWLFYQAMLILPFYFIIFIKVKQLQSFRYFIPFVGLIIAINLWEIIVYHIPMWPGGATIHFISSNRYQFPVLYPITQSIPFICNFTLLVWFFINYEPLVKSVSKLRSLVKG